MSTQDNLRQERLNKLEKMKKLGWNPYASSYDKTHTVNEALKSEGKTVQTAGKLFSFRSHGNISFADLKDETGKIQIFFKKDILGEEAYKNLTLLDIGDYIGVKGKVVKTIAGEISIAPQEYTLLTKSLLPLPHQWFGLKDIESRYRQRYLDLLLNPEVRNRFNIRTKLIRLVRKYLDDLGFWEVETPVLQPLYGGANAKPFITHLNALSQDMYLRIAFELYLKRLMVGGYEKVYEIAKDFRNEGVDRSHNPEFTMIEWYEAYTDYNRVMDLTEGLFKYLANELNGSTKMMVDEKEINIAGVWPRIEMTEILKQKLNLDVENSTIEELENYCTKEHIELIGGETKGQIIFVIFEHKIPPLLIDPIFIIDYPEDVSPLCKNHPTKKGWVERFEGYIGGKEICDGWSELTDPQVQRERFTKDIEAARKDKEEAQQVDEDFLTAMEYGMPPIGGIGIGIDRLLMFITNTWAIKETILFPTLRVETNKNQHNDAVDKIIIKEINEIFYIDNKLLEKFPEMKIGIAIIKDVNIQKISADLEDFKKQVVGKQKELTLENIGNITSIKAYRQTFKSFGVDWQKRHPSADALLRRIAQGKNIYNINTLVDAYNLAVIESKIALGAFDFNKLNFPTSLKLASGNEKITLLGEDSPTIISEGEIIYVDNTNTMTLDLNYRDADYSKITLTTKKVILYADGCAGISNEELLHGLNLGLEYIVRYCGGKVIYKDLIDKNKQSTNFLNLNKPDQSKSTNIDRNKAYEILNNNIKNKNLIKHCLAVEAAMKTLAKKFEKDENKWGLVGLVHDTDWEATQNDYSQHARKTVEWLEKAGEKDLEIVQAVLSHNYIHNKGIAPQSLLDWSLYCCDDLTGLIIAVTLILPDKKLLSVTPESVLKKFSSKSFAAGVNREQIKMCEEKLGIKLEDFVSIVLKSMQEISSVLGL